MTPVEVLGWAGALTAISIGVPQVVQLLRTRSTAGLSVMTWQAMLGINVGWLSHGIVIGAANMIVPNVASSILSAAVLLLVVRERKLHAPKLLLVSALVAGVMITADLVLGSAAFGITALLASLVSNASQGVDLVRSPDVGGVAPGYLGAQVVNQVLWVVWAVLVQDSGTIISASFTGLLAVFNGTWWVLRRLGLRPLFARSAEPGVVPGKAAPVVCES